ncbi:hypothetical protein AVEN_171856-1 [Araneus ventricosus]|uniref:Pre-C2HC domain-containing protein n=1 Tax=Araneus ventricosus TaxID=182803 RepID=A0A4Y2F618_ARAVE|nr:hypothetical protein AVEN_171856-1 [Araneus ventricosus]
MAPNPYRTLYHERMRRQIVMEFVTFQKRKYANDDELKASVQKLWKRIGEWYNSNLHHPIDSGIIKILGSYNQCLRERSFDSEFDLNDDGVIYSNFSSAQSVASDLSELNDVNEDLNPRYDIVENGNNSKDNSMEMEHSANNVILTDMTTNVKSDNIEIDSIGEVINSVIANNCNEIDMSKGEMPECNADAEIMNIDTPNSNPISADNDGYQTQGRKRGRVPSNEPNHSKKLTRSNSLPLQNKFNALANLPDAGNNQDPTNAIFLTKIPKIPPVTLKKPVNYRDLIKKINEKEGIKCNAKEAGEFVKPFCETPRDVRSLLEFLDKSNKEYFVIPGQVVKPIKIVIKGLPIDMDLEEIKTELVNKKFRVEKVNQLKRYKTREPLNIYQIHLFPSDNIKEIYHLTTLSYNIITVEPYENRQHHQCYNCQMWSHGSKNCN